MTGGDACLPGFGRWCDGDWAGSCAAAVIRLQGAWRRLRQKRLVRQCVHGLAARLRAEMGTTQRDETAGPLAGAPGEALITAGDQADSSTTAARHRLPRCRHGSSCPFLALGRCRFRHLLEEAVETADTQADLLQHTVVLPNQTGYDMSRIYSPWATATNCHLALVYDPYLAAVSPAAEMFHAGQRADADELHDLVSRVGIRQCTNLRYVEEFIQATQAAAPRLQHVRILTRGFLRHDTPAAQLLQAWLHDVNREWEPRGTRVSLVLDERLHVRRCVFIGTLSSIEVCTEWGLTAHIEQTANMLLPTRQRRTKAMHMQVYRHAGTWRDPLRTLMPADTPTSASHAGTPAPVASLRRKLRGLLVARRWRSWREQGFCSRCLSYGPAKGAAARFANGSATFLKYGGLPVRAAWDADHVILVQCGDCSRTLVGRGERRWQCIDTPGRVRARLLADSGDVLNLLRALTSAAIEIPPRTDPAAGIRAYGTCEQHARLSRALHVVSAGGNRDAIRADLEQSGPQPIGSDSEALDRWYSLRLLVGTHIEVEYGRPATTGLQPLTGGAAALRTRRYAGRVLSPPRNGRVRVVLPDFDGFSTEMRPTLDLVEVRHNRNRLRPPALDPPRPDSTAEHGRSSSVPHSGTHSYSGANESGRVRQTEQHGPPCRDAVHGSPEHLDRDMAAEHGNATVPTDGADGDQSVLADITNTEQPQQQQPQHGNLLCFTCCMAVREAHQHMVRVENGGSWQCRACGTTPMGLWCLQQSRR